MYVPTAMSTSTFKGQYCSFNDNFKVPGSVYGATEGAKRSHSSSLFYLATQNPNIKKQVNELHQKKLTGSTALPKAQNRSAKLVSWSGKSSELCRSHVMSAQTLSRENLRGSLSIYTCSLRPMYSTSTAGPVRS